MCQQTQVATVVPYFERWMARFPDVHALAEAPIEAVLACWQGLGYYSRAHNLHRAAREIVLRHAGRIPEDPGALRRLPGIGDYSAGAIASIAFGQSVPAIDGNARRVLARWAGIEGDPSRPPASHAIRNVAEALVHGPAPGDLNQALMELGATLCLPRQPACEICPLAPSCVARQQGRQGELPAARDRARQRIQHMFAFALYRDDHCWLIARRPDSGLLGGLWEFPMAPGGVDEDPAAVLATVFGLTMDDAQALGAVVHVFTHIRMTATPVVGRIGRDVGDPRDGSDADGRRDQVVDQVVAYTAWRWVGEEELRGADLPTSVLMDKLVGAVVKGGW
jgi:A/G-specific adenine glycosylase